MKRPLHFHNFLLLGCLTLSMATLAGCGEDGSPSSAVAPTPTLTPTPTPTLAPTPAPTPTPTGPRVGGASIGQTLVGLEACAGNPATADARGHITGIPILTGAKIDNSLNLIYRASDSFALDVNGFGGSAYTASDKHASPTMAYDQYLGPAGDELFLFRDGGPFGSLSFATLGLDNYHGVCFFAVGLAPPSLPQSDVGDYFAYADGIARIGGNTVRLFQSYGTLDVNYQTGAATFQLKLAGRGNPFEEFSSQPPSDIATVTASLQLRNGHFGLTSLLGGGYSGTITGMLVSDAAGNVSGKGGAGAVLTFELRNAEGDVIFGAVAAGRNLI